MDNFNEKYKDIISFLKKISSEYCKCKNIDLHINIPNDFKFNAGVEKIGTHEYRIDIYPLCFNLDISIESIIERYNDDDLKFFFRFKNLTLFGKRENATYREQLNELFTTVIVLHIFWHEIGHIEAKYLEAESTYREYDSNEIGCYKKQEQEMVADWLSTKTVFKFIYESFIYEKVDGNEELIKALQQLIVLFWISLTIEFQLFEKKHSGKEIEYALLSHPAPEVRLLYCLEAMSEAIVDVFNQYGLDDDIAEECMHAVVNDIYILIESFMSITNSPIDIKKNGKKVTECYKLLRELPYLDIYEKNDYLHLLKPNEQYLDMIDRFLNEDY